MTSVPSHGRRTYEAPSMTTIGAKRKIVDDHGVTYDYYTEVVTPHGDKQTAVYVYEAPVRLWHWINALCILVLCVTGYFIGQPPPSLSGEASSHYLFGSIRFAHFAAGQVLAVTFLARIVWAMMGNHHSRQLFLLPVWSGRWWKEVLFELRWYLFLEKAPKKYIGHNPLAQIAMFFLFVLPMLGLIITGMALYAEGMGQDHWTYTAFGWVIPLVGSSMTLHTIHRLGMWVMVCFAMTHIYVAFREDIMSQQSLISTMVSGWRMFKDDKPR
jgi:Ni/Fe-hydrogenase 1 B-type cytochrome subunit